MMLSLRPLSRRTAPPRTRRDAGTYVVVLGASMTVAVVGIAALTAIRVERRGAADRSHAIQARAHARSAVEIALQRIVECDDWRTKYSNGTWEGPVTIGDGTYSIEGTDPLDGDLKDDHSDPLLVTGIGMQGRPQDEAQDEAQYKAQYKLQVKLEARLSPIDALSTAIHAGSINVKGGKSLTVTGGPASTNGEFKIDGGGLIDGDVEAATLTNGGTITGTITVPAPTKNMPDADLIAAYTEIAEPMAAPATIELAVITPDVNPWGAANPDGLYAITMTGSTLDIRESRIEGTLVIQTSGGKVVIDKTVLIESARADYPALIVDGDVELLYDSETANLSETALNTNFNPFGAPYGGEEDSDVLDSYPSVIRGLVHLTGTLRLKSTASVEGVVICESAVTADDANEIIYDSTLFTNPPWRYTKASGMQVVPGTWRHIVD